MADANVTKQPKQERSELSRWLGFETPLARGSLLSIAPFAVMRLFSEEMDRILAQMQRAMGAWSPAIEVREQEGNLLITAELPGLRKEDVKVHIDGDTLVLEGERKQEKEEKREGYYHSERNYGTYYRSIPLPEGAKTEQTAARFENGVLEVRIPTPEGRAKRQDIPIHEGSKKAA
jgi:HSP20 family protein